MSRKKNKWSTAIFALVVLGLIALSLFDYKKMKQQGDLAEGEEKLLTLKEGTVSEIVFKSKNQTIQLKNDKGVWKLLQPLQDDADDTAVIGVLNALKEAKVQKIEDADKDKKAIDWSQYGLNPGVEIEIATDQNKKDGFKISDSSAYDGSFYVEKDQHLFLGDKSLARLADEQIPALRSHNPWRGQGEVTKVEGDYTYQGESRHVTLTKGDKGWSATPAFDLPLSDDKVNDWLQEVRDVRANDFAADHADAKTREQFGLKKPAMTVTFTLKLDGKESQITWEFGQEKDKGNQVYVHTSSRPDIYKGTKFTWRESRIPFEHMLDANQALQFPLEQAKEMELSNDGHAYRFSKGEHDWTLKEPQAEASHFHPLALADFFQKLKGLEPQAGEMPSGLSFDAGNHLVIKGDKGELLDLSWTNSKDQLRWLKISKFKERFKVSAERFNALLKTEFLSKAEKKTEKHP